MRYAMQHTIETSVDDFWRLFFDPAFGAALSAHLGSFSKVVAEHTDRDGVLHRTVEYAPKLQLPALAKKLFGDGAFTEVARYDPAQQRYYAKVIPALSADKFTIRSEIVAEPRRDGYCDRILTVENVVNIFGVGKAVEKLLEQPQRDAQARIVEFTNAWIRARRM